MDEQLIYRAIDMLNDLYEQITTDKYPASRNYIADKIREVIEILEDGE